MARKGEARMINCKKGQLPGWMVGFVLLFVLVLILSYSMQDSPDTPEKANSFADMFNSIWFWVVIIVLVIAIPVLILRPLGGG